MSPDFIWTTRKDEAANLLAYDELTDAQIAAKVGVVPRTLATWKTHPDFQARIAWHLDEWKKAVRAKGIALRERRIAALNRRAALLDRIIEERAADSSLAGIPGGTTGLIVRQIKVSALGPVEEYAVDTGLLAEMRAHEKQAAQELQQWTERQEVSGPNGGAIVIEGARDILVARLAALAERRRALVPRGDPVAGGPEPTPL